VRAGRRLALAVCAALLAGAGALAQDLQPIPPLRARVTDLTGTLNASEQAALEQKLAAFEARKGSQIAVLIVATTQPEAIEQYSIRVAEAWKLGRERSDDGAILLVAKDDRALRIEVGYGLEGALTDALSNRIIDEAIVPRFRAGDFAGGVNAGVDRMLAVIDGEPLPEPEAPRFATRLPGAIERYLPMALFAVPLAGSVLRAIFGGILGPLVAGAVMFGIGWIATGSLGVALFLALAGALFAALAGRRSRRFRRGRHGGFGGIPGGFGGGGFGGGGFSGGGGGFGGGGASGRW
jgi:uncharacterized protein